METEVKKATIAEMHTDTRILYNFMKTRFINNGQTDISYEELSASIARNVQTSADGLLRTARKHIEKDYQVMIETVASVGIRMTTDYSGVGKKTNAHLHRHSQKHRRRILNAIAGKELSPEQILPVAEELAKLGAAALFTKRKTPPQLTARLKEDKVLELPTQQALRLFQNGNDKS